MLNNKRCLIVEESKEDKSVKVNNGSFFYNIKLSGEGLSNFLEVAEIYRCDNLGIGPVNMPDPVYLQINEDSTKCALPMIPGTYIEVSIDSIEQLSEQSY